jgi:hypothetical protein
MSRLDGVWGSGGKDPYIVPSLIVEWLAFLIPVREILGPEAGSSH